MITEAGIKVAIRNAPLSGKAVTELKDDGGRGEGRLALFVRPAKDRVTSEWYAVWWRDEKRKMAKLGTYPIMGLADARKVFREDYAPAISGGRDPAGLRARQTRAGATVKELFEAYVDDLKAAGKPSHAVAAHALLGKTGAAKAFGEDRRAGSITKDDIRAHLSAIHGRGVVVMAASARAYLHAAFGFAIRSANSYTSDVGMVDWGIDYNPVTPIATDPAANRVGERHLTPAELRAFWRWLEERDEASLVAPALRLEIATGQRVMEILQLGPAAYDRQEKMLDWSKTKNGSPHAIPLPHQAVTILDALIPNKHGLYFPHSRRPAEPATPEAMEKAVGRYLKKAKSVPHFTPRDLRRTWKTLSGAAGISKEYRDRMQNHAKSDISSRHYDRYDYLKEKRAAMNKWEAYLDRILAGELDSPAIKPEFGKTA